MTLALVLILIAIAAATGALTGLTGASGMSILISGLLLIGIPIREIIALTFVVTFANGLSSTIPYFRKGLVDCRLAVSVGLSAAASVYLGFLLAGLISEDWLRRVILIGLLIAGIKILVKPTPNETSETTSVNYSLGKEIAMGVPLGILIGILGGGGGLFMSVALILVCGLSAKTAIGTSIGIVTLASVPGCLLYGWQGDIDWRFAAIIVPVSFCVAFLAARLGRKIPEAIVKRGLGIYLIVIFAIMLVKEFL